MVPSDRGFHGIGDKSDGRDEFLDRALPDYRRHVGGAPSRRQVADQECTACKSTPKIVFEGNKPVLDLSGKATALDLNTTHFDK
jgi:hypothetical protein